MKKVTKTVYVVEGREYCNVDEASQAYRAKRVEELLDALAAANNIYGMANHTFDLSHVLVRNTDRLIAAINDPVPMEDENQNDLGAAWGRKEPGTVVDTPQARLAARRERVAKQDKTSTQTCVCANKHVRDTTKSMSTGCLHCNYCGGVYVDESAVDPNNPPMPAKPDADFEAENDANEAPRGNRVHDHQKATDGLCVCCSNQRFHSPRCRFNPRNT